MLFMTEPQNEVSSSHVQKYTSPCCFRNAQSFSQAVAAQRRCSPLVCSLGSTGRPLDLWLLYFKSRTGEVWQLRSACNNWKRESSRPAGPYLKTYSSSFHRQPTPQEVFRSCGTPQDRFSVLVVWIEGLGLITLNWFFCLFVRLISCLRWCFVTILV